MKNLIVALIVIAIIGLAIYYIIHEKRKGVKCIGCPSAKNCSSKITGGCNCNKKN